MKSRLRNRTQLFHFIAFKFCKNKSAVLKVTLTKYECGMLHGKNYKAINSSLLCVRLRFFMCLFSLECLLYEQFKDFVLKIIYNMSVFLILRDKFS